jgi:hypothetical protein
MPSAQPQYSEQLLAKIKAIRALTVFLGKLDIGNWKYESVEWYLYKQWQNGKAPVGYVPPRGHIVGPQYRYGIGLKESKDWTLRVLKLPHP